MMPAIVEAATLNAAAAAAMTEVGVHACTDVSGFGLAGHLSEMLRAGGCAAVVYLSEVPLHERVAQLVSADVYAGGLRSNRDYILPHVHGSEPEGERLDLHDPRFLALCDPQTSGGLLIAVPAERHAALLDALAARAVPAWTIGKIVAGRPGDIAVASGGDAGPEASEAR